MSELIVFYLLTFKTFWFSKNLSSSLCYVSQSEISVLMLDVLDCAAINQNEKSKNVDEILEMNFVRTCAQFYSFLWPVSPKGHQDTTSFIF